MDGLGSFKVEGTTYFFDTLNPKEAIQFGSRVLKAFGPTMAAMVKNGDSGEDEVIASLSNAIAMLDSNMVTQLVDDAMAKCYTQNNKSLGDEVVFNEWFMEHKSHLFVVGAMAIFHLAKDFFPKLPDTLKKKFKM